MTVRAVVLERPGVVGIEPRPQEPTGSGQALVRFRAAGICGSDLSAYRGTSPLVTYPRVIGHEVLVDVLEAAGRPGLEGRRAVLDPMVPCGRCHACRAGRSNCCAELKVMGVHVDGGLQEEWSVDARQLAPVPDTMPDETAVLAEPLTVAYHAVQRSSIDAGHIAAVIGVGTIGLLIAQLLLRARGCRVLVVDVDQDRLTIAQSLGAVALQGDEATLVRAVADQTGGDMADVVFEASGSSAATSMTASLAAHAGRIVLVGWNQGPVAIDTVTLMRKEVDLLGSRNSVNAFPAVLRLLADGVIDPTVLITHRFTLPEAGVGLQVLDRNEGIVLKVLIQAE
ncbi:MAG TPA: alcohol dehydrogenase catalytic domain-containing protein [Chloroflexota bacterium]